MERMVMHTADRMVDAAAARLRELVAAIWPAPATTAALVPASTCPSHAHGPCAYGTHVQSNQVWTVDGTVKPGTTRGFRPITGLFRRQPERSP